MDVRVLILICCFANLLQMTYADSKESQESKENEGDWDVALLNRIMKRCKSQKKVCGSNLETYTGCYFKQMHIDIESSVFLIHHKACPSRKRCKDSFESREVCCSDCKTYSICQLVLQEHPTGVTIEYNGPCDTEEECNGVPSPSPQPTTNAPRHTTSTLNRNDVTSDIPYTDMQTTIMQTETLLTLDNFNPTTITERVCDEQCPLEYVPVCGTDGETYPSLCVLNAVACNSKPDLDLESDGAC